MVMGGRPEAAMGEQLGLLVALLSAPHFLGAVRLPGEGQLLPWMAARQRCPLSLRVSSRSDHCSDRCSNRWFLL